MSAKLAPTFGIGYQSFLNDGSVNTNGFIYTYSAGTTSALATWTTSDQSTQNGNPILLDPYGRPLLGEIWIQSGLQYKFVVTDQYNNPITSGTYDNVSGINDLSFSQNQWISSSLTPLYLTPTTFSVSGNQTTLFNVGMRVQLQVTAGTIYGTVVSSVYSLPSTTVTLVVDGGNNLDSGLSTFSTALISGTPTSVPAVFGTTPIHVSSSGSGITNLNVPSTMVIVDDTLAIGSFGFADIGVIRFVTFSQPITILNSAILTLPGSQNILAGAKDTGIFLSLGGGSWQCIQYQVFSESPGGNPPGTIIDFAGTIAPVGYLACPTVPTNLSRSVYSTLFTAIGTTWGAGDGSTTFGMPWFAADTASIQANGDVGTTTAGAGISHSHTIYQNQASSASPSGTGVPSFAFGYTGGTPTGAATFTEMFTNATGVASNLPAGSKVLKCVKK